jgi:hypothetical protein
MGQGLRVAGFDLHPIARARLKDARVGRAPEAVFRAEVFHAAEQVAHDAKKIVAARGPFIEGKGDLGLLTVVTGRRLAPDQHGSWDEAFR